MPALHDRIADGNEAREKSRKIMDRAARALADQLAAVNEAQRACTLRDARVDKGTEAVPADDARRLQQGEPLSVADEEGMSAAAHPFADSARTLPSPDPLTLTAEQVLAHPDLLGQLTDVPGADGETPTRWDGLVDATRAAAVLLAPPPTSPPTADGEEPLDSLARWLKRHKRFHLLGRLAARLPAEDQKLVHRKRDEAVDRLQGALASLHQVWPQLADLAAPQAGTLAQPLNEGRRLASEDPDLDARAADPDLVLAWLEALRTEMLRARDATIVALRYHLTAVGDERSLGLLRLLDEGRYGEVLCTPGDRSGSVRLARDTLASRGGQGLRQSARPTVGSQGRPGRRLDACRRPGPGLSGAAQSAHHLRPLGLRRRRRRLSLSPRRAWDASSRRPICYPVVPCAIILAPPCRPSCPSWPTSPTLSCLSRPCLPRTPRLERVRSTWSASRGVAPCASSWPLA